MHIGWQTSEMYSSDLQNAFIMLLKTTEVLGFTIAEAFYSVQEHETNVQLILEEVYRCILSLDILFGDFSHKSTSLDKTVYCILLKSFPSMELFYWQ